MRPGYLGGLDYWFGALPGHQQLQPIAITPLVDRNRRNRHRNRRQARQLQNRLAFRPLRQRIVVPRIETLGPVRSQR